MMCERSVGPCSSAVFSVVLLMLWVTMVTGQILRNEVPCLSEGGVCAEGSSCPEIKRYNKTGLCPEQEPEGGVCCSEIPRGVTECREHGGRCGQAEECRNVQHFGQLDCQEGSHCCLLIY
ncbi:U-scoloptoxin(19)-Tl1a isoform X2 [Parasteatoda tepidariorum]|nr:U-scoloptoxin(19)-Tl1a isoform X2 [Parasteatoda tepidariorum]